VKVRVAAFQAGFVALIRGFAAEAISAGDLSGDEDPSELAFELNGIILAANVSFVLSGTTEPLELARRALRRRLGVVRPKTTLGKSDPLAGR